MDAVRPLFVTTEMRPTTGGIAYCLDGWLTGLAATGHEVALLGLLQRNHTGGARLAPRRFREDRVRLPERLASRWDRFVLLRKLRSARCHLAVRECVSAALREVVGSQRIGMVVCCSLNTVGIQSLAWARRRRLATAAVAWGAEVGWRDGGSVGGLGRLLNSVDRLIAISKATADLVARHGVPRERIAVVHPPLPDVLPLRAVRDQPNEGMRLVTVARLIERKGVQDVLSALRLVGTRTTPVDLDIVGEGPFRGELEALAVEMPNGVTVRFRGAVSDEEKHRLLAEADLFVMTPRELPNGDVEGFGIVYLEAGVHALPVLATRSGGVPDAVRDGETGLLVEAASPAAIARALDRLVADRALCRRLGAGGRRWAEAHAPAAVASRLSEALGLGRISA